MKFRDEAIAARRLSYSVDRLPEFSHHCGFVRLFLIVFFALCISASMIVIGFSRTVRFAVLVTQSASAKAGDEVLLGVPANDAARRIGAPADFFIIAPNHFVVGNLIATTQAPQSLGIVTLQGRIRKSFFAKGVSPSLNSRDRVMLLSGYGGLNLSDQGASK